MKKTIHLKHYIVFLLLLALLMNTVMLSGCNVFASSINAEEIPKNDNENPVVNIQSNTLPSSNENDIKGGQPNYAIKALFETTEDEPLEFLVDPLAYAPDYSLPSTYALPSFQLVTVKGGSIYYQRRMYTRAEYVTDTSIVFTRPLFVESLSTKELINKMLNDITEYYLVYTETSDENPLLIFSVGDMVYFVPTLDGKVWQSIDAIDVNQPYEPIVPSDEKYNGENNYIFKSLLEKSQNEAQEFCIVPYMETSRTNGGLMFDVKLENGKDVYINDKLYAQVTPVTDLNISYDEFLFDRLERLWKANNAVKCYEMRMELLDKLKELDEYYILSPVGGSTSSRAPTAFCSIGDVCYAFEFTNEGIVYKIGYYVIEE